MKKILAIGLLIAGITLLGGCKKDSDKDDDGGYYAEMVLNDIYVVNTGNAAASIPASITVVDVKKHKAAQDVYRKQNGRDMEGTPSDILTNRLGSNRVFITYPDKDMLEVIDGPTMKSLQKISTTGLFGDKGKGPKKIIWNWNWQSLLVLTDAGYVLSFSGDTLEAEAAYEVGPESTALYSYGKDVIEVLHSVQGTEVPYISRVSFTNHSLSNKITSKELLTNPVEYIYVYDQYAFILNAGNDDKVGSVILRQWNQEPALRKIADATFACNGSDGNGNALFLVNTATGGKPTYSRYNILTDAVSPFVEDGEQYPTAIAADYVWHKTICVTSRPTVNKNGAENGHVTIYDHEGNLLGKYEAGVNPSLIGFGYVEERK